MTSQPTQTWPALDAELLADAAATYNFKLGQPTPLAVTPDGAVLFRRTAARAFAADLYELDTKTGKVRTLYAVGAGDEHLSDAEKARRERTRTATRGVVDIGVSRDGNTVMVPQGEVAYLIDRETGKSTTIQLGEAYDPRLSPDGKRIAFVRGGDLWVTDGGAPKQLTKHPEGIEYGVADFAAQEELDRQRGYWWSPSGSDLVYQTSDTRDMDTIYVADARHPEKQPVPFKYPRAGRPNAKLGLGMVAFTGAQRPPLTWDTEKYPYLARVSWDDKAPLTLVVLSREQTELAVIAYDDNWKPQVILQEHDDAWINVPTKRNRFGYEPGTPLWLADGSFYWMHEDEKWQVEHHARDGKLLGVVKKDVRDVVGLRGNDLVVEVEGKSPLSSTIEGVQLDEGVTTASIEHDVLVVTTQRAGGGTKSVAITKSGQYVLPSVAETPKLVPTTTFETVTIDGRTHYVAITRPRAFDASKRYPLILKVYGGPHLQYVDSARDGYVMDQWYADAGFIVVRSDGRGTPNRGRAWERAILKDLITIPLEDQVAALQAVGAKHHELDMSRVGVTGWSFGGYFSAMAVLQRPDVFKTGVAGAPVTDWKLYDTAYTERYMREPRNNEAGYERASVLTYAAKLSRPLLVIHGITDDNVHFANTLAFIEAMYLAGKRAEVITLSSTHMVPDPKLNLAREQTQIDFFRKNL
jgi:dipeptidyl-peptidase-4